MARHARGARPADTEEPPGRAGRRAARAARQQKRRRRTGGLLALCATALAAGAGGVISGVLPAPDAAVVAGDTPLAALSPDGTGTPGGSSPTASPDGTASAGASAPSATPTRADASPAADRGEARSPLASPGATAGTPTATATATTAAPTVKPSPSATPTTTASPSTKAASPAAAVLALVNEQRKAAGCAPVTADARLDALAKAFSDDMAARGFFDHTDPDGHTPWDRAKAVGISNLGGENIARGQATAEAVMTAWMNSPGHRANILNCQFTKLGVGVHTGSGGPWWTQDFGF
ncbi:CAP domain-containing protein [Kitasatospora sp. NPDC057015]|uniref:CAP domain-containing protein n=1 Tax=Kitasatospora sp. NPDC057015 TaxID=3346001 RepID=UPI003630E312